MRGRRAPWDPSNLGHAGAEASGAMAGVTVCHPYGVVHTRTIGVRHPQHTPARGRRVGVDRDSLRMTHSHHLCFVQSVFDSDGDGGDYAYTIGLQERGLPELHIWARPTEGEDPGLDWMLSNHDRHALLMQLAEDLVAGRATVGSERTDIYDDGLATVTYRLDPPVDADEVEAFGARPAPVIPVRWRLDRPPAGSPAPVDEATAEQIRAKVDVERWLATAISSRSGQLVYDRSPFTTAHDQALGPQRAVVRAVASQLSLSNTEFVSTVAFTMLAAEQSGWADGYDRALLAAHARVAGRQTAHDEARAYADDVLERLLGSAETPRPLLSSVVSSAGLDDVVQHRAWLLDLVRRYARTTLSAEAVADVVPADLYLSATTVRDVVLADRELRPVPQERLASPLTRREVARRVGGLTAAELRPYEAALAAMSRDDRAEWSNTLLRTMVTAARDRRALPDLGELLHGQPAGTRLRRQRRRIEQRFARGEDISVQRRRHRVLMDALDGLVAVITLSEDVPDVVRDTLLAPIPPELRQRVGRVDLVALEARWHDILDRKAG